MINWYIVQTFSGFEQKVAETLKDMIQKQKLEDINLDFLVLDAVCWFLLKITSSEKIVNFFDLKTTSFLSKISFLFKKFPSFADIEIF